MFKSLSIKAMLTFCVFMLIMTIVKSQTPKYAIQSFQGAYSELQEYQSIALLTGWDPLWTYEFQLNFPFPYFDSVYTTLFFDRSGWGYFDFDEQDFSIFLMQYESWTYDPWVGDTTPDSDARFSHVVSNGLQALVIQFTKARIFADPFEDSLDTYLNFQVWLFENGVIEVRFGDIHMDGNPIYKAGKGVYCHTTNEGIDTTDICGPLMSIANPFDESDAIGLHGSYDDYEITGSLYSRLTVLPPIGWVIRFTPTSVGLIDPKSEIQQIAITPNPASSSILIPDSNNDVTILDCSGRIMFKGSSTDGKVDVADFPAGMYFIKMDGPGSPLLGKFIKL